jgi:hypothetical protein
LGGEREAFLLWTSSSEMNEGERIATRKRAISTLGSAIEELGGDMDHRNRLTSTLRRWKGLVAREEGNWADARFEFLEGRNLAESYDVSNIPWFDAAITEAEIWEAFAKPGLELDGLKELAEKLDSTAGLYGMAGDRINEEFAAEWAEWFSFFLVPGAPRPALVTRILNEVRRLQPGPGSGEATTRTPLGGYVFAWNRFWYSALARQTEAVLRSALGESSDLEGLLRGATVLAAPTVGLEPLKSHTFRVRDATPPDSPEQLLGRITSDLEAYRAVEKDVVGYVSKVRSLWDSADHQKRKEVERAIHPGKQRK